MTMLMEQLDIIIIIILTALRAGNEMVNFQPGGLD